MICRQRQIARYLLAISWHFSGLWYFLLRKGSDFPWIMIASHGNTPTVMDERKKNRSPIISWLPRKLPWFWLRVQIMARRDDFTGVLIPFEFLKRINAIATIGGTKMVSIETTVIQWRLLHSVNAWFFEITMHLLCSKWRLYSIIVIHSTVLRSVHVTAQFDLAKNLQKPWIPSRQASSWIIAH